MKLQELFESGTDFDERFLRMMAKDAGIPEADLTTERLQQMHDAIVGNMEDLINDPDMDTDDVGQTYYEQVKQYFIR
jgi:hypothetical protein